MEITQTKFLGATVTGFTESIGWNEQSSSITVQLREDRKNRDRFLRPSVGTPVRFVFGEHKFEGLVQRWTEKAEVQNGYEFEVVVTDPRELLGGTQVILSSYNGEVDAVPNLINAYGLYEDRFGFGGAFLNESGMVWQMEYFITSTDGEGGIIVESQGMTGIKPAIEQLTTSGNGFGGPIQFRGHQYKIDLSGLPTPPEFYRIGGTAVSILDAISQMCQDGGYDYICYLEENVIKFKSVSRHEQPPVGEIRNFIASRDNAKSRSMGVELRNDITNAVVMGGDLQELVPVSNSSMGTTIWPYWGLDVFGQPIIGNGQPEDWHEVFLNAAPIADVMGSLSYHCTIPELRCALMDFDSWSTFVLRWYPEKANVINLVSSIDSTSSLSEIFPDVMFQHDMIAQRDQEAYYFGRMNEGEYWTSRVQRVYEFVRQYATEYFGRKFLVRIPFQLQWKFEPESGNIVATNEISDAGYINEGSLPFGLSFMNEITFMGQDGRFSGYVFFPAYPYNGAPVHALYDLQKLDPSNAVIQDNGIYVRASFDPTIVHPAGSLFPYCIAELSQPVFGIAPDPLGGVPEIASILNCPPAQVYYAASVRHGSFPLRIHPGPYRPIAAVVPMKSNTTCYGPWGTFEPWVGQSGVAGKVNFERDESLVPWNYGDWGTMDRAATAKLLNAATNLQEVETGTVDLAEAPTSSLGDTLVDGGPNITGINVTINDGGISTSYSMQTYTQRFAAFSRNNADRLRRLGIASQQFRRELRMLFQRQRELNRYAMFAKMGFMQNTSRAVRQSTPYNCFYGTMSFSNKWGFRTGVASSTPEELLANVRADNPYLWEASAGMSMEALLRPFSTSLNPGPSPGPGDMPHYHAIDAESTGIEQTIPSRFTLDPFGEHNDVDIMIWDETRDHLAENTPLKDYPGSIHTLKSIGDPNLPDPHYDKARLLGLRGPLMMVGWGYEYTGKPFPNDGDKVYSEEDEQEDSENEAGTYSPIQSWGDEFTEKHRTRVDKWKAGPIDLRWDNWRKVWTIPTVLYGTLDSAMNSSGVWMTIKANGKAYRDKVKVHHNMGSSSGLGKDKAVWAVYYPLENKWYVLSAAC